MSNENMEAQMYLNPSLTFENGRDEAYLSSLEDFLGRNGDLAEEERINLLQRIANTLMHFHKNEYSRNELSRSQVFMNTSHSNSTEMQSLVDLYCLVLTKGTEQTYSIRVTAETLNCSHPEVALDIIKKMADRKLTIDEVITHPFHWSDQQKVLFLCRAFSFVDTKQKEAAKEIVPENTDDNNIKRERAAARKKILNQYNMGVVTNVFTEEEWLKLELSQEEIKKFQAKKEPQYEVKVPRRLIYNLAMKMINEDKQKMKLLFELLHFFRNRYTHFDEDSEDVKMCFGSYPEGYLQFFTLRFPKLFMHVYNNMKTYICIKGHFGEVSNLRCNQPLLNVNMNIRRAQNPN